MTKWWNSAPPVLFSPPVKVASRLTNSPCWVFQALGFSSWRFSTSWGLAGTQHVLAGLGEDSLACKSLVSLKNRPSCTKRYVNRDIFFIQINLKEKYVPTRQPSGFYLPCLRPEAEKGHNFQISEKVFIAWTTIYLRHGMLTAQVSERLWSNLNSKRRISFVCSWVFFLHVL